MNRLHRAWRRLAHGCWLRHREQIRTRDDKGMVLACLHCGVAVPALTTVTVIGPAHEPALVRGVPNVRVRRYATRSKKIVNFFR